MKAAYITERPTIGNLGDKMQIGEVPTPKVVKPDEILVQVKAFSINVDDIHIMEGSFLGGLPGMQRKKGNDPLIVGSDFAGVVTQVGSGVTTFKVGQRVCGINHRQSIFSESGTWAEYTVTKSDNIVAFPESISFQHAAALVMPLNVIHGMLLDTKLNLKAKQKVLVIGASGGIGSMLVSILHKFYPCNLHVTGVCSGRNEKFVRALGADQVVDYTKGPIEDKFYPCNLHVTGVCSGRNEKFVRALGADQVVDYTKGPIEDALNDDSDPYDVVFDMIGGQSSYKTAKAILGKKGRFITPTGPVEWVGDEVLTGLAQLAFISKMIWYTVIMNYIPGSRPQYDLPVPSNLKDPTIFNFAFENGIIPQIEKAVAFEDQRGIAEAIELVRSHRAKGKVVVSMD
eukprot:CAMPEP_0183784582 /NCGR_PEP_ID=MMETSP0739-20130205/66058_1 /TAXON_ID=385413 /ORGANISM="Thalassiosira miniscula, Strain CCMP1093" /LENGTH=398 /DNA_ID=CAMNT_0026028553 /DNA_START=91 /DNA_END=1287 /DNA_ORIENTATION=+